jgi:hypothetical protein
MARFGTIALVAVVALAVVFAPNIMGLLGPGVPMLNPPVQAPAGAIASADVRVSVSYRGGGGTSVAVDGTTGATVIATPIAQYVAHYNAPLTGSIQGGSGNIGKFVITGSIQITAPGGTITQAWTIPTITLSGHIDGVGDLKVNAPPSFYLAKGNYAISGSLLLQVFDAGGNALGGYGTNAAIQGTVQVQ